MEIVSDAIGGPPRDNVEKSGSLIVTVLSGGGEVKGGGGMMVHGKSPKIRDIEVSVNAHVRRTSEVKPHGNISQRTKGGLIQENSVDSSDSFVTRHPNIRA